MNNEIFSIIMPAYNAEKTIFYSIESILNQTYSNFKIYIINDNSCDKTENIILSFSDERIIYIKNKKNMGVSLSRNIGIKLSKGKFIAFLDSDDLWVPNKLEEQYKKLINGWDVVCSNYTTFDETNQIKHRVSPEIINYSDMLLSNFIGNLTGVYNKDNIGKVYQKNKGHEDYIMWLDILKKSKKAYCIQKPLAKYRISEKSLSGNKLKAMQWQWSIYRNELNLSFIKSSYYFINYIYNALKKRK
ncbi:glycosyltransferase family 2 protein [Proteus terrae]|uniref:glycosyltransferase family 2 protein n=1 Tax=Proteus terrae TaxID=1574161 RepID=UPI001E492CAD|nr:glycosyltransferase family A protein [Proteus terrae]